MKVYEGAILSCNKEGTIYRYLVEDGGRIDYVGDELPGKYKDHERIFLGEGALIPAFVDSHIHFASFALFNAGLNVMEAKSNAEIQRMLAAFLPKTKDKVVIAFGASPHSVEEKRLILREELDLVSPIRPVFIVKYDGHACVINTFMMEILPENIKSLRGYNADTGEMNQEAFFAVTDFITNAIPTKTLVQNMQKAIDDLAAKGIGMIHTVSGVGFPKDLDVDLERWIGRGCTSDFQLRLFFQTMETDKVVRRKLPRIGGCFKTALDGCFGSMDAALYEPYEGTNQCGVLYYTDEEVTEFCIRANRLGLQIQLHAIGDRAFDQAVKGIVAALSDAPRENHRHGIIHACLPTKHGLQLCREYNIQLPIQTAFIHWRQEPDWYLEQILGKRAELLTPLSELPEHVSLGSDGPCTDPNPMLWIHNVCNHPVTGQAKSLQDALRMATVEGTYATFDEDERGTLEAGKIADMVILEKNPYEVALTELKNIRVKQMLLKGKPYQKQSRHWILHIIMGLLGRKKV